MCALCARAWLLRFWLWKHREKSEPRLATNVGITNKVRRGAFMLPIQGFIWAGGDSNSHALRHMVLSHARIPFRHLPVFTNTPTHSNTNFYFCGSPPRRI